MQVVFQPNNQDKPSLQEEARARMLARNDPSAQAPDQAAQQEEKKMQIAKKPYQFLLVSRLREYLALEFGMDAQFPMDVERVYDDFGEHACL